MTTMSVVSPFDRLRELEKKRFHKERRGQVPVMDTETLRELCLDNDGYETPELNDSLYAHFRGFQRIEGLEAYYNLKALWLESNGLAKIENLEPLVNLRCLYLSKNLIAKVENLHTLRELNTLDLSENRIESLEGLAQLPNLLSLNASRNRLTTSADLQELTRCPLLNNVDISHNQIDDPETLSVLKAVPMLKALRITGNPVVSSTRSFRKTYIAALPQLSFLDRPIFPIERTSVTAWQTGGAEAEREAKRAFVNQENEERRRSLQEFRDWQAQVRERRIKELELERAQKLLEATPEAGPEEIEVDLRGFRAITKEEYVAMDAAERAKWDARIEEAHAHSQQAKYEILNDGVARMGSKFWSSSMPQPAGDAASSSDQPPPLQSEVEALHRSAGAPAPAEEMKSVATSKLEIQDTSNAGEDVEKPAAAVVEVALQAATETISLVDPCEDDLAVRAAADADEQATARIEAPVVSDDERSPVLDHRSVTIAAVLSDVPSPQPDLPPPARIEAPVVSDDERCPVLDHRSVTIAAVLSDVPSPQPDLPPPAPVAALWPMPVGPGRVGLEPRETWDQLQQRASTAPCRLRPPTLPSAFAPNEDDERAGELAADAPTRVLTRADILRELAGTRQHHPSDIPLPPPPPPPQEASCVALPTLPLPTNAALYTNVSELD